MSGEGQDPFVSDHPARLFEEHVGGVLALTRAILHDNALAEDAAQEAFARALAARTTFDPERGTFRTWLLSIARHVAFEVLAKRKKSPGVASEATEGADDASLFDLGLAAGWGRESPEAELARAEQHAVLARALASLSPGDRELIVLRDLEGLGPEPLARVLGVPVLAAKSRLHRARLRLVAAVRSMEEGVVAEERDVGGMRCRDVLAALGDYVDGELGVTDRARVQAHLRECEVCERFGGHFSRVVRSAREQLGATPVIEDALVASLLAKLR